MINNQVHVLCSFKESSAVSQGSLFKIRRGGKKKQEKKREKARGHQLSFLKLRFLSEKEIPSGHLCFRGLRTATFVILKLPEQLYSPCCRPADSSYPTLSLRILRMMLKHYNNKALEGGSIQLREKCEEWNTETNNCPVGLCSLLVPPEAWRLPQQGSLHGKSNLQDAS